MNKKVTKSILLALAAGIAVYLYTRKRNKVAEAAADAYYKMNDALKKIEKKFNDTLS